MPTGKQIRAARMLLEWDAVDLAKHSKLTKVTILNMETGKIRGRPETMEKIVKAFGDFGVEFIGERGVNLMDDNYRILKGSDCYLRLLDEVYHTLRGRNEEALFICVDDAVSTKEVTESNHRIRNAGIKCRYLSSEEATKFDFDLSDYRLIPKEHYKNSVMIVFADKVATLRGTNNGLLIVRDKDQSDMLRGLFEMVWAQSFIPKQTGLKS